MLKVKFVMLFLMNSKYDIFIIVIHCKVYRKIISYRYGEYYSTPAISYD